MAQPISASRLDRKIDVERKTVTLDDFGQPVEAWEKIATAIAASYTPVSGDERFAASQFVGKRVIEFRVRPAPFTGIAPPSVLDRLVYPPVPDESPAEATPEHQIFDIKDVRELGRGKGWQIFAVSRAETTELSFAGEPEPDPEPEPEPDLFSLSGTFTAAGPIASQQYVGFNRGKWVTAHNWDAGSEYGVYAPGSPETNLLCIVVTPVNQDNFLGVVFQGTAEQYGFAGLSLTLTGGDFDGDAFPLTPWPAEGQATHDDCFVFLGTPINLETGVSYSFTIEEVVP